MIFYVVFPDHILTRNYAIVNGNIVNPKNLIVNPKNLIVKKSSLTGCKATFSLKGLKSYSQR